MRTRHPYAARLNSFAMRPEPTGRAGSGRLTTLELIDRAATVPGLSAVDVNFPQQTEGIDLADLRTRITDRGLRLNGLAMRYNDIPTFKRGAFTHPDAEVRRQAIDLTRRGIDASLEAGGTMLTIWPGQDGFDHPFQVDYARMFDHEVEGLRAVAEHAPDMPVSVEYKPNDPRSVMILPTVSATLLAIAEAGAPNLGVTLDFGHVLEADVSPAMAAAMVGRRSRLLGLHINDGYGRRDDGLMPGAVNTVRTIELLRQLRLQGFDGVIYFDTFPDVAQLDPVAEAAANVETMELLWDALDRIPEPELAAALERHDAVAAQRLVQRAILGRDR
ncbi:MAG: sugar phosphate isomerase/epimerase family protein [Chloroflexota bacterium]